MDLLVKVGIKSDLLDVFVVAKFYERFSRSVVGIENLLQNVENDVSGSVILVILLKVRSFNFFLSEEPLSSFKERKVDMVFLFVLRKKCMIYVLKL